MSLLWGGLGHKLLCWMAVPISLVVMLGQYSEELQGSCSCSTAP